MGNGSLFYFPMIFSLILSFREKAAKEAGVEEEEEESDDDVVTGSNPFKNINQQIVSTSPRSIHCQSSQIYKNM